LLMFSKHQRSFLMITVRTEGLHGMHIGLLPHGPGDAMVRVPVGRQGGPAPLAATISSFPEAGAMFFAPQRAGWCHSWPLSPP
jgi:hypothetical protein